jgi:hypothetical protein
MARRRKPDEPDLFALRCAECQRQLVKTASGYLACPSGHGKLCLDDEPPGGQEPCGSWFDPDPLEE